MNIAEQEGTCESSNDSFGANNSIPCFPADITTIYLQTLLG